MSNDGWCIAAFMSMFDCSVTRSTLGFLNILKRPRTPWMFLSQSESVRMIEDRVCVISLSSPVSTSGLFFKRRSDSTMFLRC